MNIYAKAPPAKQGRVETDGLEGKHKVHAQGSSLCDMETLCGHVWSGIAWVDTKRPVNCDGCLDVIRMVHANHPKQRAGGAA